jgi:RNA polymerase sigma factor (sigma-70 family)
VPHHDPHASPGDGRPDDLDAAALAYLASCRDAIEVERRRQRDDFIRLCLPFARLLSFDYRDCGEPLEDLDQTARLGLVTAVDRYDPERGPFTSYAIRAMHAEIRRYLADAPATVELEDIIGPDADLDAVDDRITLASLVELLPHREQRMLALRYFGNQSQADIAGELGLSQMQVSRLLAAATTWLREALLRDQPPPWRPNASRPDRRRSAVLVAAA